MGQTILDELITDLEERGNALLYNAEGGGFGSGLDALKQAQEIMLDLGTSSNRQRERAEKAEEQLAQMQSLKDAVQDLIWCQAKLEASGGDPIWAEIRTWNKAWDKMVITFTALDTSVQDKENITLSVQLARTRTELVEANSLLRSAYAIAERDGRDTYWTAFRNQVEVALERQQEILFPKVVLELPKYEGKMA